MNHLLAISWESFLIGEEAWKFLPEVLIRATIMFTIVLVCLRFMNRRAVMKGLFEVALIISLGSAIGDAMFYSKVGMLPSLLVIIVVVLLYRIINFLMFRNRGIEKMISGDAARIIHNGCFDLTTLRKEEITRNEMFADLRLHNVSQLGQVEHAYMEPSGKISIFFFQGDKVRFGLPILPEKLEKKVCEIKRRGYYACHYCGYTERMEMTKQFACEICGNEECSKAINDKRAN